MTDRKLGMHEQARKKKRKKRIQEKGNRTACFGVYIYIRTTRIRSNNQFRALSTLDFYAKNKCFRGVIARHPFQLHKVKIKTGLYTCGYGPNSFEYKVVPGNSDVLYPIV